MLPYFISKCLPSYQLCICLNKFRVLVASDVGPHNYHFTVHTDVITYYFFVLFRAGSSGDTSKVIWIRNTQGDLSEFGDTLDNLRKEKRHTVPKTR